MHHTMGVGAIQFRRILAIFLLCLSFSISGDATACTTIIVGAGMSGIMAAKTLSEKGMKDFIILEATNRIGGRMHKKSVGGYTVEMGANWVEGVGGEKMNPIWPLAKKYNLRNFKSEWSTNLTYNIYDQEGSLLPQSVVAGPFEKASASSDFSANLSSKLTANGEEDISILASQRLFGHVPITSLEMAIDFFFYDFETAEPPRVTSLKNVEPTATFEDFGEDSYFVADSRGYEHVVHQLAKQFLKSKNGDIIDKRLKLNKVVRNIEYSDSGVEVSTEDGSVYTANNTIVSVSAGVLQTKLIDFKPDLPMWKLLAISKWDMAIYCKIFMRFPSKFWPTGGPGTEFFMYAHEKRGYYTFWQHLENEYPGGNLLMVTVQDEEARRIEQQPEEETKAEIMQVLRKMFGNGIPEMLEILIPKWGHDRFYRGTFSNWPVGVSVQDFHELKAPVGPVYFTGEHTSQKYNGYVHGAYLAGIDTANTVLDCLKLGNCGNNSTVMNKKPQFTNADTRSYSEVKREKRFGSRARRKTQIYGKSSVCGGKQC